MQPVYKYTFRLRQNKINFIWYEIQEYFLKKLGNVGVDIYSYTYIDTKMKFATFLEFMQIRISIVSPFTLFEYKMFPMLSFFPLRDFFYCNNFNISFFLSHRNDDKAL